MSGRYLCEKCLTRYDDGAECPTCEGEPLLDVQDAQTVEYLRELDERDRRAAAQRFTVLSVIGALPLMGLTVWLLPDDPNGWRGRSSWEWAFGIFVLAVIGVDGILINMFPPRRRVPPEGF